MCLGKIQSELSVCVRCWRSGQMSAPASFCRFPWWRTSGNNRHRRLQLTSSSFACFFIIFDIKWWKFDDIFEHFEDNERVLAQVLPNLNFTPARELSSLLSSSSSSRIALDARPKSRGPVLLDVLNTENKLTSCVDTIIIWLITKRENNQNIITVNEVT